MFETAMFLESLEKLTQKCHQNSRDKGFWDGPENDNIPTKIALIHSEASEWLEAFRKGNPPCEKTYKRTYDGQVTPIQIIAVGGTVRTITSEEEEAADLFIRLLDLCGKQGIDLGRVTFAKMEYNAQRPYKHGGKKV